MADMYFGIGEEGTFKSAEAAAKYIDIYRESIIPDPGWIIPETAGRRAFEKKTAGAYRGRGNVEFPIEPENGITKILYWLLGSKTSAQQGGTAAWKHTFKPADTIKSFTGRVGVSDVTTRERILGGCLANALTVRFAHGREMQAIAEVFNAGKETHGAIGSATFSDLDAFVFSQGSVEFAESAKAIVAEGEVRINNRIPFDFGVIGDDTFPKIRVGKRLVDGRLSLAFDDTTEYARFLAGTEFKLELLTQGPVITGSYYYRFDITLPKCVYLRDTAPHVDRREQILLDAPFQAFYNPSDQYEVMIEVTNKETSI
ncbi:MAG: hypothetical protein HWN68_02280 [Desulfobacterales bacterium]|nr:hypothetical protein [Desulfobacterales bacterium]